MNMRKKKVDLEKVDEQTLKNIEKGIISKITNITDEAVKKANKILKIYGLKCKMQIAFEKDNEEK